MGRRARCGADHVDPCVGASHQRRWRARADLPLPETLRIKGKGGKERWFRCFPPRAKLWRATPRFALRANGEAPALPGARQGVLSAHGASLDGACAGVWACLQAPRRTLCGMRSQHICSPPAVICARFKSCSDTNRSRRLRAMRALKRKKFCRPMRAHIRARDVFRSRAFACAPYFSRPARKFRNARTW